MSDPSDSIPRARFGWIRSGWFLGGLVFGLAALAWLGRRATQTDFHPDFVRFHKAISPEANYYPTVDEMCAIVRGRCRPDQTLVIVGGNSILLGVWQPAADLWTRRLQELLGDRYCVINFAFRGASPTNGGAVIAEVLRAEYPRQIYIANEANATAVDPLGVDAYRYLNWQAYFGGRLLSSPSRSRRVRECLGDPATRSQVIDNALAALFDRPLRYRDFWNRVGFEHLFTLPSLYGGAVPALLAPRSRLPDDEPDARDPAFLARRYPPDTQEIELSIVRGATVNAYRRAAGGGWEMDPMTRKGLERSLAEAFPAPLHARTLILVSQNSPFYRSRLTPDETARDEQGFRDTVELWRQAGYDSMEYGRDFNEDDFGDRNHLSKFGAAKLAEAVAPEVRSLADRLGYRP